MIRIVWGKAFEIIDKEYYFLSSTLPLLLVCLNSVAYHQCIKNTGHLSQRVIPRFPGGTAPNSALL